MSEVRASNFSLMLAADLAKYKPGLAGLDYSRGKLASRKIDGMRVFVENGVLLTRNRKPVPNRYVQSVFSRCEGLDGEMVVGAPMGDNVLSRTLSGLKSRDGEPDATFFVIDDLRYANLPFSKRYASAKVASQIFSSVVLVEQVPVRSEQEVLEREEEWVAEGWEGLMLRSPHTPYRYGRCAPGHDDLWKLKRFIDGEAVVTGLEEAETNNNEMFRDELGRAKRTSHKANRVGNGMIGTILASDPEWGPLRLQPGIMTHEERRDGWVTKALLGQTVHWRAFGYDVLNKPRYARYYGVRADK